MRWDRFRIAAGCEELTKSNGPIQRNLGGAVSLVVLVELVRPNSRRRLPVSARLQYSAAVRVRRLTGVWCLLVF
jgi:hypothetical protein